MGKRRKTLENIWANVEKHGKTERIRGKHRKTRGNKGIGKTGEYIKTQENFYIYWGHNMESYMRY